MLGKLSKPEEYRGAAVFLLSDASSFMTGADLKIDGMCDPSPVCNPNYADLGFPGGHTAW